MEYENRQKKFLSNQPQPAIEGLQQELALLEAVTNREVRNGYLIWQGQNAIVVPKSISRKPKFYAACQLSASRGWPIVVRETGGDATPISPGLVNVAFVSTIPRSRRFSMKESYLELCLPLIEALKKLDIDAGYGPVDGSFCDGDYNLTINGKKLAGTAQRWKKIKSNNEEVDDYAVLVHAVVLCQGNLRVLINSINDFYHDCDIPPRIQENQHVMLSDTINKDMLSPDMLVPEVIQLFEKTLKRLVI
jgi:lipoate-protein ligase A